MKEYLIGKVVGVSGDTISIFLNEFSEIDENILGVPENMSIIVDTANGPQPILVGQPGSFVCISLPNGKLLSMYCRYLNERINPFSIRFKTI